MRHIIALLLTIFLVSSIYAQHKRDKWVRLGLFTSCVVFNAVGDGLYDDGHKLLSKSFKAASIGSLLVIPIVTHVDRKKGIKYVATFGLLRYAIFDAGYNLSRNLPYNYVGTTSVQDKLTNKLPPIISSATKILSLGLVIHLNNKL